MHCAIIKAASRATALNTAMASCDGLLLHLQKGASETSSITVPALKQVIVGMKADGGIAPVLRELSSDADLLDRMHALHLLRISLPQASVDGATDAAKRKDMLPTVGNIRVRAAAASSFIPNDASAMLSFECTTLIPPNCVCSAHSPCHMSALLASILVPSPAACTMCSCLPCNHFSDHLDLTGVGGMVSVRTQLRCKQGHYWQASMQILGPLACKRRTAW